MACWLSGQPVKAKPDNQHAILEFPADGGNVALLAELDSTGKRVGSFGPGGVVLSDVANHWNALAIDAVSGYIFTAGDGLDGHSYLAVGKYNLTTGRPDNGFGDDGVILEHLGTDSSAANSMTLNGDKILLAGYEQSKYVDSYGQQQPSYPMVLLQFNEDGTLDQSFGAGGILIPPTLAHRTIGMGVAVSGSDIAVVGQIDDNTLFVADYQLGSSNTTYTYDVRNKMVGFSNGTNTAGYVYDDAGNRVAETVATGGASVTSFYLTDQANPTGYAEPVEVWTSADGSRADAGLHESYFLGDRVLGQVDALGAASYLLTDGHGSTRQLTDAAGLVTHAFTYDAFGTALNFTASSVPTVFLFGGDSVYDPASGLYMHGNGVRDRLGFEFIQRDPSNLGINIEPISLHKYLYADANPINEVDPTGYFGLVDTLGTEAEGEYLDLSMWENEGGALGLAENIVAEVEDESLAEAELADTIGNNASNAEIQEATENVEGYLEYDDDYVEDNLRGRDSLRAHNNQIQRLIKKYKVPAKYWEQVHDYASENPDLSLEEIEETIRDEWGR